MGLKVEGAEIVKRNLMEYGDNVKMQLSKTVARTTLKIETSAKRRLQRGPKTGEVYQKYSPRRLHQASGPGEAPASDTGTLVNNVEHNIGMYRGVVFTRKDYGKYLELGTRHISPRPWLFPSAEEHRQWFIDQVKRILKRGT